MKKLIIIASALVILAGCKSTPEAAPAPSSTPSASPIATITPKPTVESPTPAPINDASHPVGHIEKYISGDLNKFEKAPNQALMVVETDYIDQVKKMNKIGEYTNKLATAVILHAMTHQKIQADQIGWSVKMTTEMIDLMIENVTKSTALKDQEREDFLFYLNKWKDGDFADMSGDHNFFWKIQGGTVGYATGNNTPVQEAAFISSRFPDGRQTASEQ
jgi:hypothetical protein